MAKVTWKGLKVTNEVKQEVKRRLWRAGYVVEGAAKKRVPVITGNLKNSINTQVSETELLVQVGTNVKYAAAVELGTANRVAKPYLRPALEQSKRTIARIMGSR